MLKYPKVICAFAVILALSLAGCAGGSGSPGSSDESTGSPAKQEDRSAVSKEFAGVNGINPAASFGSVAGPKELEEADAVVAASLSARGSHDWAAQCATLSAKAVRTVIRTGTAKGPKDCVTQLTEAGEEAAKPILADNLKGSVAVFRVKGSRGYALYHGNDEKDWAMPMEKEGGEWKVASLVAEVLAP